MLTEFVHFCERYGMVLTPQQYKIAEQILYTTYQNYYTTTIHDRRQTGYTRLLVYIGEFIKFKTRDSFNVYIVTHNQGMTHSIYDMYVKYFINIEYPLLINKSRYSSTFNYKSRVFEYIDFPDKLERITNKKPTFFLVDNCVSCFNREFHEIIDEDYFSVKLMTGDFMIFKPSFNKT